jgi:hypothetical protein
MFDLSRLTASMAGIFGASSVADALGSAAPGLQDLLQNAGLDPNALAGLSPDAATELLTQYGIDPSALMDGQLEQLLSQIGVEGQIPEALAGLWADGSSSGND